MMDGIPNDTPSMFYNLQLCRRFSLSPVCFLVFAKRVLDNNMLKFSVTEGLNGEACVPIGAGSQSLLSGQEFPCVFHLCS